MADITREGWLFQWQTQAPACQPQWPSFRHDQQGSGNYDRDGTPPGPFLKAVADGAGRRQLHPGLHGAGRRRRLRHAGLVSRARPANRGPTIGAPAPGGTAVTREVTLPAGTRKLAVQARGRGGEPRSRGDGEGSLSRRLSLPPLRPAAALCALSARGLRAARRSLRLDHDPRPPRRPRARSPACLAAAGRG